MAEDTQEKEMPFLEHLEELRWRILKSLAAVVIFAAIAYGFSGWMIDQVTKPLVDVGVFFKHPTEAFMVRIKISIFAGAVAAVPVLFYNLWMFVAPGLYRKEIKVIIPIIISATLFFLGGGAFCFFYVLPLAVKFLLGYATENMKPMIMIGDYIGFAGMMVLAFGIVFELPIASFLLGRMGVINSTLMARGRRYAVVGILILGAILTPPDVFSQMMLACPLYLLYEISIIVVRVTQRRQREKEEQA